MRSSDTPRTARTPARGQFARTVVLEGMPGAGKTSLLNLLADRGHAVLGEYIDDQSAAIPITEHPALDDDAGHLANWVRKDMHASAFATAGTLVMDRNWLTALAWAYSCPEIAGLHEFERRTAWAAWNLEHDLLEAPDTWLILNCTTDTSLNRRRDRLNAANPWTKPEVLERLRAFYADPAAAIGTANAALAGTIRHVPIVHLDAEQQWNDVVFHAGNAIG